MSILATFYDHVREMAEQREMSMAEALQTVKALGIELLEISQNNLLGREAEVARELGAAGLGVSAIPAYFDFGRDLDVEKQAGPTLEAARLLGANKLLVIPGFWKAEDDEAAREEQVQNMRDCINRLGELAEKQGVTLVMEDYDNALAPFASIAQVKGFVEGCPRLFSCFDTGNFRFAGDDVLDAYDALRERIRHVHLKDRAYQPRFGDLGLTAADGQVLYPCPVGGGDLPLGEVIARLRADGYDGVYTIEHYGAGDQLAFLQASVRWVKAQLACLRGGAV